MQSTEQHTDRGKAALPTLIGVFGLVCGACAVYTCLLVIGYTASTGAYGAYALFALALAAIAVAARKTALAARLEALPWFRIYAIVQLVSIPAMIMLGYHFLGSVGEDYQDLADMATAAVQGEPNPHVDKYGAYPNNHLLLMFMIVLFGAIHAIDPSAGQAQFVLCHAMINIALVQASFAFVAWGVRSIWGERRGGIAGLLMVTCSPIWLNCTNPYSDTSALSVIALAFLILARFLATSPERRTARILLLAAFGVMCGIGFKLKATVAVLVVAFCLVAFFMMRFRKAAAATAIIILSLVLSVAGCNAFVEAVRPDSMPYGAAEQDRWEFPYVHWTMMSMNPGKGGVYSQSDYNFTAKHESYDEKREACTKKLEKRLEKLGPLGVLYRIGVEKPANLLQSGALIKSTTPAFWVDEESALGPGFLAYLNYAQAYHLAMLGLVALSALALWGNRRRTGAALYAMRAGKAGPGSRRLFLVLFSLASLFGFLLFICLFWEAKARYPVHFLPLFIALEADGLALAWRRLRRLGERKLAPTHSTT